MALSDKSRAILEAMAKGHTYEQILVQDLAWTYHDIFKAVAEALDAADGVSTGSGYEERMEEIRKAHPRAYEKWTPEEDERLKSLFAAGNNLKYLAHILQRQPSAIRSRLAKLSLVRDELSSSDESDRSI